MANMETSPIWKKVYLTISSKSSNVTENVVGEVLKLYKDHFVTNLLKYKPYTKDSFKAWKKESALSDLVKDDEMCNFVHVLSRNNDLDVNVAWTIICNFLMFEYYGKVDELKNIIKYDTNLKYFVDTVWYFYSGERMFLLKSLRYIFEFANDNENAFHQQFQTFITSIDLNLLWKNLLKVFDNLISGINQDNLNANETLTRWIHRTNREQVEVVLLLNDVLQFKKIDSDELETVLTLFMKHGFTRLPLFLETITISNPKDLLEIKNAEISVILSIMEKYWNGQGVCKMLPETITKHLETHGDNYIVLFGWSILQLSIRDSDDSLNYCNAVISNLIEKDIFGSLVQFIKHPMFKNCFIGNVTVDAVHTLIFEFSKICADFNVLCHHENIFYLTAELLKRKGKIVLDYMGPIFDYSVQTFPFVFNNFLEICKSFIALPGNFQMVMKLLKSIPSFSSEIPWNDIREQYQLTAPKELFKNSAAFVFPAGTTVERFTYGGSDFTRFVHPFDFFALMEIFAQSLIAITPNIISDGYYKNLVNLVEIGYNFIIDILTNYEGNFKEDHQLNNLIKKLDFLPMQFCVGPAQSFSFVKVYFEIKCVLVKKKLLSFSEAFPININKKVFPKIHNFQKVHQQVIYNQLHNTSIVFKYIKVEENMDDHGFLIIFLKLLKQLTETEEEVQEICLWYVLNAILPHYQQWTYNDPRQLTKISQLCCSIFIQVLQKPQPNKMCLDYFMHDEILMLSYLSVFLKDKFYIQNLMQQESNWTNGPLLENIECIRLQLVLLLLLFKNKTKEKCTLDDKISIIAKAVSAYMVNPYSVALRILSCRFIEILAKDKNIFLMALLDLDYDQVERLFLDKLRDPTEDDNLKLHILSLIGTCIFTQDGMTAAFFNVVKPRKWYNDKEKTIEGDTVSDFMIDYLQNIKKSHEYLRSPLQFEILRVMANLWITRKQQLIKDVIALESFWTLLAEPLYTEYNQSPKVYTHILKIFTIQLKDPKNDTKFLSTVKKFVTNEAQLNLWQQYLLNIFKIESIEDEKLKERILLLESWMEFIVLLEKQSELQQFSDSMKYKFVENTLSAITYKVVNNFCLTTWLNFLMIQVSTWELSDIGKQPNIVPKIVETFTIIKFRYNHLSTTSRRTTLVAVQHLLRKLKTYFEDSPLELREFLEQLSPIFDFEYNVLAEQCWKVQKEAVFPWLLCINISNDLLQFKNVQDFLLWFSYRNYLQRIITTALELSLNVEAISFMKIILRSLSLYVASPMAFDILNVDLYGFYVAMEASLKLVLKDSNDAISLLQLEEGWEMAVMLMKFNAKFFKTFQYKTLQFCYSFIELHHDILENIFKLPESKVALKALDLVINTLIFFNDILTYWQKEWYKESNSTYNFVMMSVMRLVNSSLYTILRPKSILIYTLDNFNKLTCMKKVPIELTVGIMNKLINVAGLGFSILYKANPSLLKLTDIDPPVTLNLISNDFRVPEFRLPIPYELTYGKLLCLVHFFCKTLDAISHEGAPQKSSADLKKYYTKCVAVVAHQGLDGNLNNQKLSSFLRYTMYEYSGLADPWIQKLDYDCVKYSFELLMTFLAQQIYIAVIYEEKEQMGLFTRNLSSELQFFYEYVKKYVLLLLSQAGITSLGSTKGDDLLKKYFLYCKEKDFNSVVEKNYCLFIWHWLIKTCNLG